MLLVISCDTVISPTPEITKKIIKALAPGWEDKRFTSLWINEGETAYKSIEHAGLCLVLFYHESSSGYFNCQFEYHAGVYGKLHFPPLSVSCTCDFDSYIFTTNEESQSHRTGFNLLTPDKRSRRLQYFRELLPDAAAIEIGGGIRTGHHVIEKFENDLLTTRSPFILGHYVTTMNLQTIIDEELTVFKLTKVYSDTSDK